MFDEADVFAYPPEWDAALDRSDYLDGWRPNAATAARVAEMLRSYVENSDEDPARAAVDVLNLVNDTHRASIAAGGDPWGTVLVALVDLAARRLIDALGREKAVDRLGSEVEVERMRAAAEAPR